MHWTISRHLVSVSFLVGFMIVGPVHGKDSLSVSANAPTVGVAPRDPGQSFLHLPALEYTFEIRAHCADGRLPKSLSLNVADSRKSLAADEIVGDGPTELSLRIPASQLAPLVVENFCVAATGEHTNSDGDTQIQVSISSALSAQASLLCEGENDKAMTYVSRPLDVSLVCERVAGDGETQPE